MSSFLSQLKWRFATKKFNPQQKVNNQDLEKILEAIRMTPTSHGLQAFHVYVISDQTVKDALVAKSYNQKQVAENSHVLVFCYRTDIDKCVDEYVDLVGHVQNTDEETLAKMRQRLHSSMQSKKPDTVVTYVAKQVYIALGFALAACAELEIDSCPMEGFEPSEVDKILQLPENMSSVLLLPIGYRSQDSVRPKVRFPKEKQFTFVE